MIGTRLRRGTGLAIGTVLVLAVALIASSEAGAESAYLTATFHYDEQLAISSPLHSVGFENVVNNGNGTFTARPGLPSGTYSMDFPEGIGTIRTAYQYSAPTGMSGTYDAASHTATYDLGLTLRTLFGGTPPPPTTSAYRYYFTMHMTGSYDPATGVVDLTSTFFVPGTTDRVCGCDGEDQYYLADYFYSGTATANFVFRIPAGATPTTTTTPSVPGAVGDVAATPGNTSVKVQWSAAASPTGPVLGYSIACDVCGGPAQTTTATSLTWTGLTNGVPVRFQVSARNATGTGPPSPSTPAVTPGVPAAPILANAVSGNGSATVQWYPAQPNGAPVTGHQITTFANGVPQGTQGFNTSTNSDVINGLTVGTTYTFRIAAVNSYGIGVLSAATAPIVMGIPSAPTAVTAASGNGAATVRWNAPASNGAPVTGYVVTPFMGPNPWPAKTFQSAATSAVFTGLANGYTYTFKVTAQNSYGAGPASAMSPPVKAGIPPAPSLPAALPGNGTAKVSWWPAVVDNGSPISAYWVTPYIGAVAQETQNFYNVHNAVTLTGLANGTTYTFRISGWNANGQSPLSAATAPITVGAPAPPAAPTATAGAAQGTVNWGAGVDNGSPITSYVVTPLKAGVPQTAVAVAPTARSLVLTGLSSGGSYTFAVTAVNSRGAGPISNRSAAVTIL